jgi:spiro-SPASM protein
MPRPRFAALASAFASFAGEGVVDISLWGEPSFHPEVEGLVDDVLSHPGLSLIVETSGIGWKEGAFERLSARWPERLHFVLSLDAVDPELYASLRGPGFEEALGSAGKLLSLFPKSAYIQTLRVHENEAALEDFWRGWKKRTEHVIVQKYSRFAGFLPPRKVTDLSPLKRRPCWHLKRDLSVLLDGRVPLCRECVRDEIVLGNLFGEGEPTPKSIEERLASIWIEGERYHKLHVSGDYPAPCAECDEYYTYNA